MIRRAPRTAASVAVVLGWALCLVWLTLSVSQIAVGRVSPPDCRVPPIAATMTAPELNRAILDSVARC